MTIKYSSDGWKSFKVAQANYKKDFKLGLNNEIESPNSNGVENWSFDEDLGKEEKTVEFVLEFEVNGERYCDSNFERKYKHEII